MTPAEVLNRAADLIERDGLTKDGMWTGWPDRDYRPGDACCVGGAIAVVTGCVTLYAFRNEDYWTVREAFADFLGVKAVARWNDAPERTAGEVVTKLREAAQTVTA